MKMMMQHKFVEFIPEDVQQGMLYVSVEYGTAVHKCCCGCGEEVVTPLTPTDWKLIFDGATVSLHPSIGNWSFKCQSHYYIRNDEAKWCASWKKEQIIAGKSIDAARKAAHFKEPERDNLCTLAYSKVKDFFKRI
jgi:hypothetical protein